MGQRTKIGIKLALTSVGFLCLTIFSAITLRQFMHADHERSPASVESGSIFEHRGYLSAAELGLLGSTPLLRGRRTVFHETRFRNQVLAHPNQVVLNLFPDLSLVANLRAPSAYTVNEGVFVGQIEGDSDSTVRILIQNGIVDGTIEYRGSEYRLIDGANSQAIVTQAKKSVQ
jgi:hypothetical protein